MNQPYPKSETCSAVILNQFQNGTQIVGVVSPMQNGKSDLMAELSYQWIQDKNRVFIVDAGLSSVYVRDQQEKRFLEHRQEDEYNRPLDCSQWLGKKIYHLPDSNKLNESDYLKQIKSASSKGKEVLIIRDEADFGSGNGSNLEKFLIELDLKNNPNIKLLLVTATPQVLFEGMKRGVLKAQICYLPTEKGYYGLIDHYNNGLLKQTFDPNLRRNHHRTIKLLKDYQSNFNKKAYVVRVTARSKKYFHGILDTLGISSKEYSYRSDNIKDFAEDLKTPFSEPTVLILDRSYSAGATLEAACNKNIWIWHDAPFNKNDRASAQSAARPCGYKKPFDFPILMDMQSFDKWAQMIVAFEKGTNIQNIVDNHSNQTQGHLQKNTKPRGHYEYQHQTSTYGKDQVYKNLHNNGRIRPWSVQSRKDEVTQKAFEQWKALGGPNNKSWIRLSLNGANTGEKYVAIEDNGTYHIFERKWVLGKSETVNNTVYTDPNVLH